MKKTRILALFCILALVLTCAAMFTACSYDCAKSGHKGGTATCTQKAVCEVCGEEYGDLLPHTEGTPATCQSKAVCSVCNQEYGELGDHVVGTPGTCTSKPICAICGQEYGDFHHTWVNGVCSVCETVCTHSWTHDEDGKGSCTICDVTCVDHDWTNLDGECAICGLICDHSYDSETGACTVCGYQCLHDDWTLGICDECGYVCQHAEWSFGICKVCSINAGSAVKDSCAHEYANGLCKICGSADPTTAANSYTYNMATSSMTTMWNELNYQSNDATQVTDYTTDGLFIFDYNSDKTGYQFSLGMAKSFPQAVEITDAMAEKWGFEKDADGNYPENRVWSVTLRNDLKFDNGDPIKADDYINTMIRLLDGNAANYRADSVYSGNFVIHNAENYLKQGKTLLVDCTAGEGIGSGDYSGWDPDKLDGGVSAEMASQLIFSWENSYVGNSIYSKYADYVAAYGMGNFIVNKWIGATGTDEELAALVTGIDSLDGHTLAEIVADESMCNAMQWLLYDFWCTDPDEEFGFFCYEYTYPTVNFSDVGLYKVDDYTLVVVLDKPLEGFYLNYSFYLPLVHIPTYDKCAKTENGVYSNDYGTSVSKYVGYGPYKLVGYVSDSILQFAKNPYWYGYNVENQFVDNVYQATNIVIKQVTDEATRLQMFLKGELDSYGLLAADMADYQSSKYTYYTEGDSTWFVALNPDFSALETVQASTDPVNAGNTVNKTILTIKEFRQALSFSINRAEYELTLDPTGGVAKSLYGNMIISDPENGVTYRATEQAKDVIIAFWGLTNDICDETCPDNCEQHIYATKDEAIASITGYDPTGAKSLFDAAYAKAVELGYITAEMVESGKWEVQIMIGQPGSGSSTYYNKGYEYLSKCWTEAVKGTALEGHLTFRQSQPLGSSNFSDYLKNNTVDILFGVGWTGSSLDPYSLMEAYTSSKYQYDPSWDTKNTYIVIDLPIKDGAYNKEEGTITSLKASVWDWTYVMMGGIYSANGESTQILCTVLDSEGEETDTKIFIDAGPSADGDLRLAILAKVEGAVLEQYDMIPVGLEASASMRSERITYFTEEYVFGMGRGGLKYYTFKYTDAEWAALVASQPNGEWNYKVSENVE